MKNFALVLTAIGLTMLSSTSIVLAEDGALQTMARITMGLNHFPSDDDKEALMGIINSDDASEQEADVAMAISNFEHKIVDKDTERLTDIINDESSKEGTRKLASILLRTNHSPSDEDKTVLAALAGE